MLTLKDAGLGSRMGEMFWRSAVIHVGHGLEIPCIAHIQSSLVDTDLLGRMYLTSPSTSRRPPSLSAAPRPLSHLLLAHYCGLWTVDCVRFMALARMPSVIRESRSLCGVGLFCEHDTEDGNTTSLMPSIWETEQSQLMTLNLHATPFVAFLARCQSPMHAYI